MRLDIGAAQRNCVGETVCGDSYAVFEDDDVVLIAVSDGLGHGPEAATASLAFLKSVEENRKNSDLIEILYNASSDIAGTRGVVAAVVRISKDDGQLGFCGIGNIEFVSRSAHAIRPISAPGILGRPIRSVRQFDYIAVPGDLFAIFSDGVSSRMDFDCYADRLIGDTDDTTQAIAQAIIDEQGKNHDDGTCVIVRVLD